MARLHVLVVVVVSSAFLSSAEDTGLVVIPAVRAQDSHSAEPVHHGDDHDHDDDHHVHDHDHDETHNHDLSIAQPTGGRFSPTVWSQALLATALVGVAPVLVLLVVPLGTGNKENQQPQLRVFLSFAAGGLLGDALLHLLPHSLPGKAVHHHDHKHEHHSHSMADLYVWLWTLAGLLTFLLLEKFVRAQTLGGHGHSHGYTHPLTSVQESGAVSGKATTARKRAVFREEKDNSELLCDEPSNSTVPKKTPIAAAGYLNLAADFSHNFTDGLAIGATFLRGTGWTTTMAMLLHELPHEIGDYAILIQSGFTRREAMVTQLFTAIGAMIGTVIGLLMEGAGDSSSGWISPFTAGGFIYIACTNVMPELLDDCSLAQSLKEMAAMCAGIGLMTLIALNE